MELIKQHSGKSIYRDGDKCLKVFDDTFSKADILNEALNHARVESTGLNIPALLEVTKIDGKWAIVTEFVEGKTLRELMDESADRSEEYLNKFVDLQMEVLSKSCPMLNKLWDKMSGKISQSKLDATTRYELHTRLDGMRKHHKVCHGDFWPSNIIVTPEDKYYIIDWSHATQGNGAADAARTYLLFHLAGKPDLAEDYLNLFCQKSDTAKQYVQKWLPIVAASQSVKGKPEEQEMLLKWADVVEYE